MQFTVSVSVSMDASSPKDAAIYALHKLATPVTAGSWAIYQKDLVFEVTSDLGSEADFEVRDLLEDGE